MSELRNGHRVGVEFNGTLHQLPVGIRICEFLGELYLRQNQVVGATLNHHLVSLDTAIDGESSLAVVTCQSPEGQAILRRTATYVFQSLVRRHFPDLQLMIGQSLMGGYYYELLGHSGELLEWCARVNQLLSELIERDVDFERHSLSVEALSTRLDDPFGFKRKLIKGWAAPRMHVLELEGHHQLMMGPCAPSTGCLSGLQVMPYPPGVVLSFPAVAATSPLPNPQGQNSEKLFKAYRETRDWNQLVGVAAVGDLTEATLEDRFDDVVRMAEALHEKKIAEIADSIASRRDKLRLVCIAGPSSSGKTTFGRRLAVQLQVNGLQPVPISLDNYYRGRDKTPLDEFGELDFEALEALDLELLDQTLGSLLQGQEVRMARYDFATGAPTARESWPCLKLRADQIVVIEGIHGLNPGLFPSVPPDQRYHIFVSALTQLVIDEQNRIFTSDARLLRRIVRDRQYRGFSAADTISRWPSVRRGEERYIFPYQDRSDAMFNSTLVYETAVLRNQAWRFLLEVPRQHPSRVKAYELLKFLELFVPVYSEAIPATSVLREFIGGSAFQSF
ncbi:nucleoside kinase [bacterium]|nr:nucleoside kinase [bacterium]